MGLIQDAIKKLINKRKNREAYEEQQRVMENYEKKKKSLYEREYERRMEEIRQQRLKEAVERFRKKDQREFWSGRKNNPIYEKNVFKNQKNIFKGQKNLFGGKTDLREKSIFMK